jgi:serine/threonine protein phosphatase 1
MTYVTADLHGYPLEKFKQLLAHADFSDEDFLFIIGDVIDRGEHGVELLKWLMVQPNVELIRGNHEAVLLACSFLFDEITKETLDALTVDKLNMLKAWQENGAGPTLDALSRADLATRAAILEYIMDTPLYDTVSVGDRDFLLVHGGLGNYRDGKRIGEYTEHDLLWTRIGLEDTYSKEFTTLVGHTPTFHYGEQYRGKILHTDTWIDLDTGSGYDQSPALLRLEDMKEFYMDEI